MESDHDLLIELKARVARIESDIESEKATRSRSNERLHEDIEKRCSELAKQRTSWFERVFWLVAGATVSALATWMSRK